jgi:tetratricopeptide (TPR) repeat protein
MTENREYNINKGLAEVNKAKKNEREGNYKEAAKRYKAAKQIFKECKANMLYAKSLVAHFTNKIKFYFDGRGIEELSENIDENHIEQIVKGIKKAGLDKFDEYDLLITTYRELEKIFYENNMDQKSSDMYYERTKLYFKFFWKRAFKKDRGYGASTSKWVRKIQKWRLKIIKFILLKIIKCTSKIRDVFKSVLNLVLHFFCGHGERPIRAFFISTTVILAFSVIFCHFGLIEYSEPLGKEIHWPQALYFSVITFTTVGYGDIQPKTTPAQLLAGFETLLGYLMLGIAIAIIHRKITR